MKLFAAALGIVSLCAAGVAAQVTAQTEVKSKTKEKTKIEVKDGKDVTVAAKARMSSRTMWAISSTR